MPQRGTPRGDCPKAENGSAKRASHQRCSATARSLWDETPDFTRLPRIFLDKSHRSYLVSVVRSRQARRQLSPTQITVRGSACRGGAAVPQNLDCRQRFGGCPGLDPGLPRLPGPGYRRHRFRRKLGEGAVERGAERLGPDRTDDGNAKIAAAHHARVQGDGVHAFDALEAGEVAVGGRGIGMPVGTGTP